MLVTAAEGCGTHSQYMLSGGERYRSEDGMRAVHEDVEGPFVVEEDLAIYGVITGGATLRSGVKLILHGTIAGDLIIEPRARAIIHGTVAGRVRNEGGHAEIFGLVEAIEDLSPTAVSVVDAVAHVGRGRASEKGRGRA